MNSLAHSYQSFFATAWMKRELSRGAGGCRLCYMRAPDETKSVHNTHRDMPQNTGSLGGSRVNADTEAGT